MDIHPFEEMLLQFELILILLSFSIIVCYFNYL